MKNNQQFLMYILKYVDFYAYENQDHISQKYSSYSAL